MQAGETVQRRLGLRPTSDVLGLCQLHQAEAACVILGASPAGRQMGRHPFTTRRQAGIDVGLNAIDPLLRRQPSRLELLQQGHPFRVSFVQPGSPRVGAKQARIPPMPRLVGDEQAQGLGRQGAGIARQAQPHHPARRGVAMEARKLGKRHHQGPRTGQGLAIGLGKSLNTAQQVAANPRRRFGGHLGIHHQPGAAQVLGRLASQKHILGQSQSALVLGAAVPQLRINLGGAQAQTQAAQVLGATLQHRCCLPAPAQGGSGQQHRIVPGMQQHPRTIGLRLRGLVGCVGVQHLGTDAQGGSPAAGPQAQRTRQQFAAIVRSARHLLAPALAAMRRGRPEGQLLHPSWRLHSASAGCRLQPGCPGSAIRGWQPAPCWSQPPAEAPKEPANTAGENSSSCTPL